MDIVWWGAITLELIVLSRALVTGLFTKYFLFSIYLVCVLVSEIVRFACYEFTPNFYPTLYWCSELILIVASYSVVIEIFRQAFKYNPGLARLTRHLLLILLTLAVTYASLDVVHNGFVSLPRATADVGRYLRYIEGMLLLVILWVLTRYRIQLGFNLLGITMGNAFWVAVNVTNLTVLALHSDEFSTVLRRLLPIAYVGTLVIWCAALWSVQKEAERPNESDIERDYQALATRTRAALAQASNRLARVVRP